MRLVHRVDPRGVAAAAVRLDDEDLPIAPPPRDDLEACPNCGVQNAVTASVCWFCEIRLSADGPDRSEVEAEADAEEAPAAVSPEEPTPSSATDNEPTRDNPLVSPGSDFASVGALGDPAAPNAPADLRWLAVAVAVADPQYPVLTQTVEGNSHLYARSRPTALADRRMQAAMVAAAIVALALLGAGVYLYSPMSPGGILDATLPRDTLAGASAIGGVAGISAPTNVVPTNAGSTALSQAEATESADAKALATAARALAVKPNEPTKATPAENTTGLADAQRAKARGVMRSSNAAAAAPKTDTSGPARQTPEQLGPCTATVAALGLCTPPPTQSKE